MENDISRRTFLGLRGCRHDSMTPLGLAGDSGGIGHAADLPQGFTTDGEEAGAAHRRRLGSKVESS